MLGVVAVVAGCRWREIQDLRKAYDKQPVCIEMFERDNERHQAHVKRSIHNPSKSVIRVGSSSCSVAQWDFNPEGPYLNAEAERMAERVRKLQADGWEMPASLRYSKAHPDILQGAVSRALEAIQGACKFVKSLRLVHPCLRQLHTGMTLSLLCIIVPSYACMLLHTYPSMHLHYLQRTSHTTGKSYSGPPSIFPTAKEWSDGLDPTKKQTKDLGFVRTLWDESWRWFDFDRQKEQWHERRPHSGQRGCTIPRFDCVEDAIKSSEKEQLASAEADFKEWIKATPGAGARYPREVTARRCMVDECARVTCYQGICTQHLAEGAQFSWFLLHVLCVPPILHTDSCIGVHEAKLGRFPPVVAGYPPFEWAPIRLVRSRQWQKNLDPTMECGLAIMVLKDLPAGTHVGNYGGMLIDEKTKEDRCVLEVHTHARTFTPTHTHTHTHLLACVHAHT